MAKKIITNVKQSKQLANQIAKKLKGGEVLALIGPLGSGKTTFTQHLAKALGVKSKVSSPTFVLMQTYATKQLGQKRLFLDHFDLYRLESEKEILSSGLAEHWGMPDVICAIEWADKAKKLLPKHSINIIFKSI